jgi:hypothetical protein
MVLSHVDAINTTIVALDPFFLLASILVRIATIHSFITPFYFFYETLNHLNN